MPRRQLKVAVALATAAASLSLAVAPAHSAPVDPADPTVWTESAKTLEGTAKYQYAPSAVADGYKPVFCGAHPTLGGMGFHYINEKLYGSLDPAKPAALLYEDRANEDWMDEASDASWVDGLDTPDGGTPPVGTPSADADSRRLVAAEWIVVDKDQDLATDDDRPSMFGVPFDGPMLGHAPGMPIHYDLHAWVWKNNPSGTFARWNPTVTCPTP
ncbi:hypothetical protein [Streptomyces sp. SID12488]|uniref:hypothetical protein n=1 Tax=Streptomyces sp. SID12488 TaxID=2706040 RepID=UPI0013D9AE7C|nr:hypothetical protein [Streptomyces sp. SID12488]NEA68145.1 hypothetical protein [Streptomyces sp. SID12488]